MPILITAGYMCGIPGPKREYTLPEGYLELLEQKRYSPSTIKTLPGLFQRLRGVPQRAQHRPPESGGHQQVHSLSCKRKENFCFTQNMRINAIKFYYEQVKGGKRQYYGGITRAKEYNWIVPEVLSKNEIKYASSTNCLTSSITA